MTRWTALLALCLAPLAQAQETKPKTTLDVSGLYTAWGLTQQNFFLGAEHPLDDAAYVVQMLRAQVDAKRGKVGATVRLDAGQGWWGVDNNPNTADVTLHDEAGNPIEATEYNDDALFRNKDTNFGIHVDWAYGWAEFDLGGVPLRVQAGRQYYGVGNKLVLDQDLDGITAELRPDVATIGMMWAKVSEGRGSYKSPVGLLMTDGEEYADGDLLGLTADFGRHAVQRPDMPHHLEVFALYYADRSNQDDWTFFPNGLGYFRARFQPNISTLFITGVAADGRLGGDAASPGLLYKVEGDFLTGADNVANTTHAGGALDVNDGSLLGYNAYIDLKKPIKVAKGMDVGAVFGMGSGDADKTGGPGNVNKLQTMGFFPFTNVWEDSVMPDYAGISPQGLGSPASRGYREFENTIAAQAKFGVKPVKPLRLEASYTYLAATTPIQGFDEFGTPVGEGASDIGMEVDANVIITFDNGLLLKTLGGVFLPGSGAGNLINGNNANLEPAWEIKNVVVVTF